MERLRWYLAGKIDGRDWRGTIVTGLEQWKAVAEAHEEKGFEFCPVRFPVLTDAVLGLPGWDYVGPYYCPPEEAWPQVHGAASCDNHGFSDPPHIKTLCLQAVADCDVLFAWVDDINCPGTLIEIGYAAALAKRIVVAISPDVRLATELWMARECATERLPAQPFRTAREALLVLLSGWEREEERRAAVADHQRLWDLLTRAQQEALRPAATTPEPLPVRLDPQRNFSGAQKQEIYLRCNGHCVSCGQPLASDWHADHIVPHSRGGRTEVVNGHGLCQPCNSRKRAKVLTVDE